jgi:hypothetical protein
VAKDAPREESRILAAAGERNAPRVLATTLIVATFIGESVQPL